MYTVTWIRPYLQIQALPSKSSRTAGRLPLLHTLRRKWRHICWYGIIVTIVDMVSITVPRKRVKHTIFVQWTMSQTVHFLFIRTISRHLEAWEATFYHHHWNISLQKLPKTRKNTEVTLWHPKNSDALWTMWRWAWDNHPQPLPYNYRIIVYFEKHMNVSAGLYTSWPFIVAWRLWYSAGREKTEDIILVRIIHTFAFNAQSEKKHKNFVWVAHNKCRGYWTK